MNGLCQAPSCDDGRLNGTEEGVDCGGICDDCQTRQLGCEAIDDRWPAAWIQIEEAVLAATNRARSAARRCGQHGHFEAAPPLGTNDLLRCAARRHSSDMADRNFFGHTSPDMATPVDRIREAGYRFEGYAENILRKTGRVQNSANHGRQVVNTWLRSPGHCKNIMNPNLTELGPGYFGRNMGRFRNFHTQVFGRPD